MFARIFGRPQSNELTEASANFKRNLNNVMKGPVGIQNLANVEKIFNYQIPGKKSTINKIKTGLAKRVLAAIGKAQGAQVAAAAGAIPQAQAVQQINIATKQLTQIPGTNYYRRVANKNNKVYNQNGKLFSRFYFNGTTVQQREQGPNLGGADEGQPGVQGPILPNRARRASNRPSSVYKPANRQVNGKNIWKKINFRNGSWVNANNKNYTMNNQGVFTELTVGSAAV